MLTQTHPLGFVLLPIAVNELNEHEQGLVRVRLLRKYIDLYEQQFSFYKRHFWLITHGM